MLYPLSYEGRRMPTSLHEMGAAVSTTEFQAIPPPFGGIDVHVPPASVSDTSSRFRTR